MIAENAQLLHCEMTYTDTDPWVVGWIVCDCSVSFVNAEKLEHMFENTKMDPQKLLRAIFEFTKEVIWAEQMRAMEEKTRAFTGMFSDAVTSTFM